ncbi:MAG: helix-turn-helix domain-containing protein [Aquaticitalea sp.]
MKEINITAKSTKDSIKKIQAHIGGEISERFGLYTLDIDNDIAKGCIRFMTFDWGINLIEHNIIYYEDILLVSNTSKFNPLYFIYCSDGYLSHRFQYEKEFQKVDEFHSSILTTKQDVDHQMLFPEGVHLIINIIGIERKEFLKKRLNYVSELNSTLHKIFVDENNEQEYAFHGPIDLKMEDHVKKLRYISNKTISEALKIEGSLYQLLSMHITRHEKFQKGDIIPDCLSKRELKTIRRSAKKIIDDPAISYSLDQLSTNTGLSQAKLQDGYKFLYGRTVTEYIRHIRLETARDLMDSTDLNISQIVYTIGFTSRSYFSKIFKEKYGMTPMELKKQIVSTVVSEV